MPPILRSSKRDSFLAEPQAEGARKSRRFATDVYDEAYGSLARSTVRSESGEAVLSETLWQREDEAGTIIFVVRRSGCPLCRTQALLIAHCRPILNRLGFQTIAILNCDNSDNADFRTQYWGGSAIYIDKELAFARLLGGGKPQQANAAKESLSMPFMRQIVHSLCVNRVRPGFAFKSRGPILGGSLMVLPDRGVVHMQKETALGDFGELPALIKAAFHHSPYKDCVKPEEVEKAIRAHQRRVNARLRKF